MAGGSRRRGCRTGLGAYLVTWLALALLASWAHLAPAQVPADEPLAWRTVDPDARDVTIAVDDRAAGRSRSLVGRQLLQGSQEVYVSSAAAADLLQAGRLWQAMTRRLTLRLGDRDYRFTGGSRLVVLDGRDALLPVPVLEADGDVWLPMVFFTDVLAPESALRLTWDAGARRLDIGERETNVASLRVVPMTRATSVRVRCDEPLSYRATSPETGIIELKIYGAQADPGRLRSSGRGLVDAVEARQYEGALVLTIRVDDLVTRYRTTAEDEGREIVLTVEEEQIAALPEPVPRGQAEMALRDAPVDVTRSLEVRTVVIDPGHGGADPGVAGLGGLIEKDVNLGVALALRDELRRRGFAVVLTRDQDRNLSLAERAEIANAANGDLFISLHCNGWFNEGARGLETYFLSPAKSDWSQSVEAVENRGHDEPDDVDFIVWDLVQNRFISASSDLAEVVQAEVTRRLGQSDRGVRQAGFRVLVGAWMPAVLVEMGFLTHPEESSLLGRDAYRRRLAAAIAEAVVVYRDRVGHHAAVAGEGEQ
ncbi:MAG: N-acetylmuramoyl-L-alanine amidase [Candidatus Krumholzibacteriia bacterium]